MGRAISSLREGQWTRDADLLEYRAAPRAWAAAIVDDFVLRMQAILRGNLLGSLLWRPLATFGERW